MFFKYFLFIRVLILAHDTNMCLPIVTNLHVYHPDIRFDQTNCTEAAYSRLGIHFKTFCDFYLFLLQKKIYNNASNNDTLIIISLYFVHFSTDSTGL